MSEKEEEKNKLATLRTLLAVERNYLAEERTQLARLRTGLAFALIVPSLYLFIASVDIDIPLYLLIVSYTILGFFVLRGVWTVYSSRSILRQLRKKKAIVKKHEKQIVDSSKDIHDTFINCIDFFDLDIKP
jgi:uncharacterized membrane protein YidH (DUF202 family)